MCPVVLNLSLYLYSSKYNQLYSSWFNPCCNHTAVYQHSSLALAVPKYKCCVCPPLINLPKRAYFFNLKIKKEWLVNWLTRSWCPSAWLDDWLRKEVCAWFLIGPWGSGPLEKLTSASPVRWEQMSALHSVAITFLLSAPLCLSHVHTQASMHPYSTSQFISWNQKARRSNSSKATGSHISTLGSCMGLPSASVWENIFSVKFF